MNENVYDIEVIYTTKKLGKSGICGIVNVNTRL